MNIKLNTSQEVKLKPDSRPLMFDYTNSASYTHSKLGWIRFECG